MHTASAMGAADSACAAPALHRLGPLLGEIVLSESLEHAHQLAIEHSGRGGIGFTRHGRDPRLVDQVEAMAYVARQDHGVRLGNPTDRGGRRVADRPRRDRTGRPIHGRRVRRPA